VLAALRAYQNPDGGFGHALEPDLRAPHSEPVSALHALDILAELNAADDAMTGAAARWVAGVGGPDGGVPFVLPAALAFPRAPWMEPGPGGSHLTFAIAAALHELGWAGSWLDRATDWCWARLDGPEALDGYWVMFALGFLDHVPDEARARAAIERLRPLLRADGSLPVPGGTEGEQLPPSRCPGGPAAAAGPCSPRPRSRPAWTRWRPASSPTAAGLSTFSPGHPASRRSGAGSSRCRPWSRWTCTAA
jgi:hypothetical protein